MTITHHPSETTLAGFAAGTLGEGRALVVSAHLAACAICRSAVRSFERLGGVALKDAEPLAMDPAALQRALREIASETPPVERRTHESDPLAAYAVGDWRWIGRGLRCRSVGVPEADGMRVFMLKAAPGKRIPHHTHSGCEWTCVLQGEFRHQFGRYGPGDFDEADESIDHEPIVADGAECVCVVALQGHIRLRGWIGRLIQPFVQF